MHTSWSYWTFAEHWYDWPSPASINWCSHNRAVTQAAPEPRRERAEPVSVNDGSWRPVTWVVVWALMWLGFVFQVHWLLCVTLCLVGLDKCEGQSKPKQAIKMGAQWRKIKNWKRQLAQNGKKQTKAKCSFAAVCHVFASCKLQFGIVLTVLFAQQVQC